MGQRDSGRPGGRQASKAASTCFRRTGLAGEGGEGGLRPQAPAVRPRVDDLSRANRADVLRSPGRLHCGDVNEDTAWPRCEESRQSADKLLIRPYEVNQAGTGEPAGRHPLEGIDVEPAHKGSCLLLTGSGHSHSKLIHRSKSC